MGNNVDGRLGLDSVRVGRRAAASSGLEAAVRRQGSHRLETRRPRQHDSEDGLIRTHGGMGLLYWTGGKLSNCRIRVVYKMRDFNDNSGVFIRIPLEPREEWMPVHYGYEVQIDKHPETSNEDEYNITAPLYSLTKPLAKDRNS